MKKKLRLSDIHLSKKEKIILMNEATEPKEKKKMTLSIMNKTIKKNDFHPQQQPYEFNDHFHLRKLFFKFNPPKSVSEFHVINSLSFILVNILFYQVRYAKKYEEMILQYIKKDKPLQEAFNQTTKKLNINSIF